MKKHIYTSIIAISLFSVAFGAAINENEERNNQLTPSTSSEEDCLNYIKHIISNNIELNDEAHTPFVTKLHSMAHKGNPEAQYWIGCLIAQKNPILSADYFEMSANQGYNPAIDATIPKRTPISRSQSFSSISRGVKY